MEVEEAPVSDSLSAAQKPSPPVVGTVIHAIRNDKEVTSEVMSIEDDIVTFARKDGCQWTQDVSMDPVFSPETSWTDCYGSTGEVEITGKNGDIWPLQVGSSVSYEATGTSSNSSDPWPADYECEVVDEARITVAAGTFDTFKVSCSTRWRGITAYYAPSIEQTVKMLQWPKNQSSASRYDWEFVSVEEP